MLVLWPDLSPLQLLVQLCASLCGTSENLVSEGKPLGQAYFNFGKPKIFLGDKLFVSDFRVVWKFLDLFACRDIKLVFSLALDYIVAGKLH